jgi:hypothetical protein
MKTGTGKFYKKLPSQVNSYLNWAMQKINKNYFEEKERRQ